MRKNIVLLLIFSLIITNVTFAYTTDEPSSWAKEFVDSVSEQNILNEKFFEGFGKSITRGEFAYLGVRLYEYYTGMTATIGDAAFTDTSDDWVLKAKNTGIVGGYLDGTFAPNKEISRQELAVLFVNIFDASGIEYLPASTEKFADDDKIASWAKKSVYITKANGIINGVGNNTFDSEGSATKEQSLIMFSKGQTSKNLVNINETIRDDSDEIIVFVDKGFENAFRELYPNFGDVIYKTNVEDITELDFYGNGIIISTETLDDLKWFSNLEYLNLTNRNVRGNLSVLSGMENLQRLYLKGSYVNGDISSLGVLSNLKELDLNFTPVTGNLSSLSNLNHMEYLDLEQTSIVGDLSSLVGMSHLSHLMLRYLTINGELSILSTMSSLEFLALDGKLITGDLLSLSKMRYMNYLILRHTSITADLSSLQGLNGLEGLALEGTIVTGSLSSLSEMKNMTWLCLTHTTVTGDLSSLGKMSKMENLWLGDTRITGDLSSLVDMNNMDYLSLGDTKVTGDLSLLSGMLKLSRLEVAGTKITGSVTMSNGNIIRND